MALVIKDRIKETSTTSGTGTLTLDGASTGFASFSEIGSGNTTYYVITNSTDWEVGIGTVGTGTLSRDTILASSNAGSAVDWTSAIKDVFCTYPAEKAVYEQSGGLVEVPSLNINSSTTVDGVLDEDTLVSDSATKLATQQSIKAYVDGQSYVTDGDKGDVVVSSSGSVWTVESAAGNFDVTGDLSATSATFSEAGTTALFLNRTSSYGDLIELQRDGTTRAAIGVPGNNLLSFDTGGTEAMRIDSSGNVGIGTSSPDSLLHLASTGSVILTLEADTDNVTETHNPRIEMSQDGGAVSGYMGYASGENGISVWSNANYYVRFGTNNTERMRIDSSGDLLVGTTAAESKVTIATGRQFDPTDSKTTNAVSIIQEGGTQGNGQYSTGITFSKINSSRPGGAIVSKQTSSDADQPGLAFLTHGSSSSTEALSERAVLDHAGNFDLSGDLAIGGTFTAPSQPAFHAYNGADDTNVTGNGAVATVDFNNESFDQGSNFSADTFTAPVGGKYQLNTTVRLDDMSGNGGVDSVELTIVTSNGSYQLSRNVNAFAEHFHLSVLADMDASDTAYVTIEANGQTSDTTDVTGGSNNTYFSGFLVC